MQPVCFQVLFRLMYRTRLYHTATSASYIIMSNKEGFPKCLWFLAGLTALSRLCSTVRFTAPAVHIAEQAPDVVRAQTRALGAARFLCHRVVALAGKDIRTPGSLVFARLVDDLSHLHRFAATGGATLAPDEGILVADPGALLRDVVTAPGYLVAVRTNRIVRLVLPTGGTAVKMSRVTVSAALYLVAVLAGVFTRLLRNFNDIRFENVGRQRLVSESRM